MMFILNIVVWYLAIGCAFTILVDMSTEYARKKGIEIPDNGEWNNETRIIAILVWPLGLLFFIDGFIRSYYNNNNKNNK